MPAVRSEISTTQPPSIVAPMLVWLLIQLAALLLAATEFPLWARYPGPGSQWAIHEMLVIQITASAALFPYLLRDRFAAATVILTSWVFLQLAGLLSDAEPAPVALAGIYLSAWLAGLGVWRSVLRSPKSQLIGVAVALLLSVGGCLLLYLRTEFSPPGTGVPAAVLGPLVGALYLTVAPGQDFAAWWFIVIFLTTALLTKRIFVFRSRKIRGDVH